MSSDERKHLYRAGSRNTKRGVDARILEIQRILANTYISLEDLALETRTTFAAELRAIEAYTDVAQHALDEVRSILETMLDEVCAELEKKKFV